MKKSIALILIFALLLSIVQPISVYCIGAEPVVQTATGYVDSDTYYGSAKAQEDGSTVSVSVGTITAERFQSGNATFSNKTNVAASALRSAMKARENEIEITLQLYADEFVVTEQTLEELGFAVFEQALAHTGDPAEGDYLRWHFNSFSFYADCSSNGYVNDIIINYTVDYYTTAAQEAAMTAAVENLAVQLQLYSNISDYDKICNIYNYICANVTYDYENLNDSEYMLKYTAYAALMNKTAVCQGYATLFYRLALLAGVDCRVITGWSFDERHAWNIVALDGKYYLLDSTWDAGVLTYSYFLKSQADFSDHIPETQYTTQEFNAMYPLSDTSYTVSGPTVYMEGGFQYIVSAGQATLTGYVGTNANVVVPATLGGYPVVTIGRGAFYNNSVVETLTFSEGIRYLELESIYFCSLLRSIHFPSTIQLISYDSANVMTGLSAVPVWCTALETVTVAAGNPYMVVYDGVLYSKDMTQLLLLPAADPRTVLRVPDGVLSVGSESCAYNPNLKEVILPDSVEYIGYWAFNNTNNLEKINIPEYCEMIGQYAFNQTSLTAVHVPAALTTLMTPAFWGCPIETITVDPNNPYYFVRDNVLYFQYEDEPACLVLYPAGSDRTEYTVLDGVNYIDWCAFANAKYLRKVVLPASVEKIGYRAFAGCISLEAINIPDGVCGIEEGAFSDCSSLKSIRIPAGVTSLEHTFADCRSLESVTLPDGLRSVGVWAFSNCTSLKSIEIPASVTELGAYSFSGCEKLESISFLGNAPTIADEAFSYATLTAYYPAGNTTWTETIRQSYGASSITWVSKIMYPIGWVLDGDKWVYYADSGEALTGLQTIDGNCYYFDEHGYMQTGWVRVGKDWYYMDQSGVMATGWRQVNGAWYYLNDDGTMRTGWLRDGAWYYLRDNGEMAVGLTDVSGTNYYFGADGTMQTGWHNINGVWYLFDEGGAGANGWVYAPGEGWYYLTNGKTATGWLTVDGQRYYMGTTGIRASGWRQINGEWYYLNADGTMRTGWLQDNGVWYYMGTNGIMTTGWQLIDGVWYYMNASGTMRTGWLRDGAWYYLKDNGMMAVGLTNVAGTNYYFSAGGLMQTGWRNVNGTWYLFNENGAGANGWVYAPGEGWYYLNNGKTATGWVRDGGDWYYMDTNGTMATGWRRLDGSWYYFSNGGAMVTGTHVIDGVSYTFNSNGIMVA